MAQKRYMDAAAGGSELLTFAQAQQRHTKSSRLADAEPFRCGRGRSVLLISDEPASSSLPPMPRQQPIRAPSAAAASAPSRLPLSTRDLSTSLTLPLGVGPLAATAETPRLRDARRQAPPRLCRSRASCVARQRCDSAENRQSAAEALDERPSYYIILRSSSHRLDFCARATIPSLS